MTFPQSGCQKSNCPRDASVGKGLGTRRVYLNAGTSEVVSALGNKLVVSSRVGESLGRVYKET